MSLHDLAVIGAGPAGLAAAVAAARAGLSVVLLDAADRPGGQYYRHAASENPQNLLRLRSGLQLVDYCPGHRVWTVEPGFTVHALVGERESRPVEIEARTLVIAAGAHDRSLPFPGWDLPGVMTAGGAQAFLKGNRVTPGRRMVVAGTGPFLLPVATGLAAAGVDVPAVYEANRPVGPRPRALLGSTGKVIEAARYGAVLARHRIPYRWGYAVVAAHGSDWVEAVSVARLDRDWYPVPGSERIVECDALAVGYGFTPQLELPLQLGCATRLGSDGNQVVAVDAAQHTSVSGVFAAGETTGVAGVQAALAEGELAGLAAVERRSIGGLVGGGAGGLRGVLARRRRALRFAGLLHETFAVREGWASWVRDDTLVCRCEEVPYRDVVAAVELGAGDGRVVKLFSRAGMGWCQGRVCGYAMGCLTARLTGGVPDPAHLGARPIAQPIRLGTLAGDNEEENI